ncbi:hypothetical protein BDZ45DRAFT_719885 [Acephala macrosclerotiorum]|nr:hypothetical protein BDZ45DRAFT_719885 [Acephala macrosclerotiorum]
MAQLPSLKSLDLPPPMLQPNLAAPHNQGPRHALPSLDEMGIYPQRLPDLPVASIPRRETLHLGVAGSNVVDYSFVLPIQPRQLHETLHRTSCCPAKNELDRNMLIKIDDELPAFFGRGKPQRRAEGLQRQAMRQEDQGTARQGLTPPQRDGDVAATVQAGSSEDGGVDVGDREQSASTLPIRSPTSDTDDTMNEDFEQEDSPSTVAGDGIHEATTEAAHTLAISAGPQLLEDVEHRAKRPWEL